MTGRIFISYRRVDSQYATDQIYDQLVRYFGAGSVFMDIDTIPLGVNFRDYIDQQVSTSDIVLAVIGDHWLTATDPEGNLRLENSNDFVRLEIEAALKQEIKLIPLFIGGVQSLPASRLPESMKELPMLNATRIRRSTDFEPDVNRLIRGLDNIRAEQAAIREKNKTALEKIEQTISPLVDQINTLEELSVADMRQQKALLDKIEEFSENLADLLADTDRHLRADVKGLEAELDSLEDGLFDLRLQIEQNKSSQQLAAVHLADAQAEEARLEERRIRNKSRLENIGNLLTALEQETAQLSGLTLKERRMLKAIQRKLGVTLQAVRRMMSSPDELLHVNVRTYQGELDQIQTDWHELTDGVEDRVLKEEAKVEQRRQAEARAAAETERKAQQQALDRRQAEESKKAELAVKPARVSPEPRADVRALLKKIPVWAFWAAGAALMVVLGVIFGPNLYQTITNSIADSRQSTPVVDQTGDSSSDLDGDQDEQNIISENPDVLTWIRDIADTTPDFIEDFSIPQSYWDQEGGFNQSNHDGGVTEGVLQIVKDTEEGTEVGAGMYPFGSDALLQFKFSPSQIEQNSAVWVSFRIAQNTGYSLLYKASGDWDLVTFEGSHDTVLAQGSSRPLESGHTYNFQVFTYHNTIVVRMNQQTLIYEIDQTYSEGIASIAFIVEGGLEGILDNIQVWDLSGKQIGETDQDYYAKNFYTPIREYLAVTRPTFEEDFGQLLPYMSEIQADQQGITTLIEWVEGQELRFDSQRENIEPHFGINFPQMESGIAAVQLDFRMLQMGPTDGLYVYNRLEDMEGSLDYFAQINMGAEEGIINGDLIKQIWPEDWVFLTEGDLSEFKDPNAYYTMLTLFYGDGAALFLDGRFLGYADNLSLSQQHRIFFALGFEDVVQVDIDNIKYWDLTGFVLDLNGDLPDEEASNFARQVLSHTNTQSPDFQEDFETPQTYWNQMRVDHDQNQNPVLLASVVQDGRAIIDTAAFDSDPSISLLFDQVRAEQFAYEFDYKPTADGGLAIFFSQAEDYSEAYSFEIFNEEDNFTWGILHGEGDDVRSVSSGLFEYPDFLDSQHRLGCYVYHGQFIAMLDKRVIAYTPLDHILTTSSIQIYSMVNDIRPSVEFDNFNFWNLDGVELEEVAQPTGEESSFDYERILANIENELSPTFEDDFSNQKADWGSTSEGLLIYPLARGGKLYISDHVEDVDWTDDHAVPGLIFPTNGLFNASNFLLEFDYSFNGVNEIGIQFGGSGQNSGYKFYFTDSGMWFLEQEGQIDNGSYSSTGGLISFRVLNTNGRIAIVLKNKLIYESSELLIDGTRNSIYISGVHGAQAVFDNFKFWNLDGVDVD